MTSAGPPGLDAFFAPFAEARPLYDAVRSAVEAVGSAEIRVSKSQVAFRRRRAFAWVWVPARYLRGPRAPLVLTVALRRRDSSTRWKSVVEPSPGRFVHHLEIRGVEDVDGDVRGWIEEAWRLAG